jgi:hypothetical protein
MSTPVRLYIGTPTANGFVAGEHASSLAGMLANLHGQGIATAYRNIDGPNLTIQRDMLAAEFLASDFTHCLLIDPEMGFAPALCQTLLAHRKQVIGAAYATGPLDLSRLEKNAAGRSLDAARALSYEWNVRLLGGSLTVQNGIGQVEALGPGFLLIERSALARVAADEATPTYASPAGGKLLPALFRDLTLGGAVLSHDFVFCRRWAALGGETWVFPQANVRRIAEMRFGMPYRRVLEASELTRDQQSAAADKTLASDPGA